MSRNGYGIEIEALRIISETYRWTVVPEVSNRALWALQTRLGISDRETRLRVTSALVGRSINSFNDLLGGEVRALLDEPNLKAIAKSLIERGDDGSTDA